MDVVGVFNGLDGTSLAVLLQYDDGAELDGRGAVAVGCSLVGGRRRRRGGGGINIFIILQGGSGGRSSSSSIRIRIRRL